MNKENAIVDLRIANREIRKRHNYFCGLVSDDVRDSIGCGDLFFESPDGQNGELFYELRKMGWRNAGFNAEYYWKVTKDGWIIEYVEGDVYIQQKKVVALSDNLTA
jgi:hypothetical protein